MMLSFFVDDYSRYPCISLFRHRSGSLQEFLACQGTLAESSFTDTPKNEMELRIAISWKPIGLSSCLTVRDFGVKQHLRQCMSLTFFPPMFFFWGGFTI